MFNLEQRQQFPKVVSTNRRRLKNGGMLQLFFETFNSSLLIFLFFFFFLSLSDLWLLMGLMHLIHSAQQYSTFDQGPTTTLDRPFLSLEWNEQGQNGVAIFAGRRRLVAMPIYTSLVPTALISKWSANSWWSKRNVGLLLGKNTDYDPLNNHSLALFPL